MNNKIYCGIDIGKQGAIAILYPDGAITTIAMPKIKTELDYVTLSNIINTDSETHNAHITFEKLGVIFGSSKQTAFSMGEQSGAVEMACIISKTPYSAVKAKDWQKNIFQGIDEILKPAKIGSKTGKGVRDTKAMALLAVKRLFPNLKLTFGERATVPHDGLIDAVLIAEYSRRMNF